MDKPASSFCRCALAVALTEAHPETSCGSSLPCLALRIAGISGHVQSTAATKPTCTAVSLLQNMSIAATAQLSRSQPQPAPPPACRAVLDPLIATSVPTLA